MSALATRVSTPTASLEKSTRKPTARVLSLALPAPTRGRLRESNPHRTAGPPPGNCRAPPAPAPPPAHSDGSVASDPLVVVESPMAIVAGTYGNSGRWSPKQARIRIEPPAESGRAALTRIWFN